MTLPIPNPGDNVESHNEENLEFVVDQRDLLEQIHNLIGTAWCGWRKSLEPRLGLRSTEDPVTGLRRRQVRVDPARPDARLLRIALDGLRTSLLMLDRFPDLAQSRAELAAPTIQEVMDELSRDPDYIEFCRMKTIKEQERREREK